MKKNYYANFNANNGTSLISPLHGNNVTNIILDAKCIYGVTPAL